jgi:hypothetical protein
MCPGAAKKQDSKPSHSKTQVLLLLLAASIIGMLLPSTYMVHPEILISQLGTSTIKKRTNFS